MVQITAQKINRKKSTTISHSYYFLVNFSYSVILLLPQVQAKHFAWGSVDINQFHSLLSNHPRYRGNAVLDVWPVF
jgi:hypothetical protein